MPGTTIYLQESKYKQHLFYDMPGMHAPGNLYNLISTPNRRALLAWNKLYSPPILRHSCLFYGGKVEAPDLKIVPFGLGGACASDNRWFLLNRDKFWVGLPPPH